jgi:hypothetical protein
MQGLSCSEVEHGLAQAERRPLVERGNAPLTLTRRGVEAPGAGEAHGKFGVRFEGVKELIYQGFSEPFLRQPQRIETVRQVARALGQARQERRDRSLGGQIRRVDGIGYGCTDEIDLREEDEHPIKWEMPFRA